MPNKLKGSKVGVGPDPIYNPITSVKIEVHANEAKPTDAQPAAGCILGIPCVVVRSYHIDPGYFLLDPCNMTNEQMVTVCDKKEDVCHEAQVG